MQVYLQKLFHSGVSIIALTYIYIYSKCNNVYVKYFK